jgi:hypothetical protein
MTCRDNLVEFALDQGSGNGYYEILLDSTHNLFYNETLVDLRHIAIHYQDNRVKGPRYNVMVHMNLVDTDLNWHGNDGGHNLFESSTIDCKGHTWPPFAHGTRRYAVQHPGVEGNVMYKVAAINRDGGDGVYGHEAANFRSNPQGSLIYAMRSEWCYPQVYPMLAEPPRTGTLYPVTGVHRLLPGQQESPLAKLIAAGPAPKPVTVKLQPVVGKLPDLAALFADLPKDIVRGAAKDFGSPEFAQVLAWNRAKTLAVKDATIELTGAMNNVNKVPGGVLVSVYPEALGNVDGQPAAVVVAMLIPTETPATHPLAKFGIIQKFPDRLRLKATGKITGVFLLPCEGKSVLFIDFTTTSDVEATPQ